MIGSSFSAMLDGIDASVVRVEADVSPGIPLFSIVGLPDSAVRESKLRIRAALRNSGLEFPNQRITVNLSPASVRKRGAGLDLSIAIAILRASRQVPPEVGLGFGFCAELGLNGSLIAPEAMVNLSLGLRRAGMQHIVTSDAVNWKIPIPNVTWYLFPSLADAVEALRNPGRCMVPHSFEPYESDADDGMDIAEVAGQDDVKRSLMVAAVGRHHVMMVGPPGCGKTMMAERYSTMLPRLNELEMLEVYSIHQAAGLTTPPSSIPPVRIPHHSLTPAGMVGGTSQLVPGEATLAHRGVLIVDELLEFSHLTLESLREPLVNRRVRLHRGGRTTTMPADFQLIATLNPCPCGQRGFADCLCKEMEVLRYWSRLSGALADRIDMTVSVRPIRDSQRDIRRESSAEMRSHIDTARTVRQGLVQRDNGSRLDSSKLLSTDASHLLNRASLAWSWSQRAIQSLVSVATSVCALEGDSQILRRHMEEAIAQRGQMMPSKAFRT